MIKQSFGELLNKFREDRKISMGNLANMAQMNPAHLSRLVHGKSGTPTQDTVNKLAKALCKNQQPELGDVESVERQLLEASGYRQNREELIDDLSDRFSDRLRNEGFPEGKIDEALARVPLATMRKVLLGEERLEIGYREDISPKKIQALKDAGEEVIMFDQLSSPEASALEVPPSNIGETASSYLDKHAEDFVAHRRQQRTMSSQGTQKIIRAGRGAEIHVHRPVSKSQEQQLRLIAKLITTILEEKS